MPKNKIFFRHTEIDIPTLVDSVDKVIKLLENVHNEII